MKPSFLSYAIFIVFLFGCSVHGQKKIEPLQPQQIPAETSQETYSDAVKEYAMLHQISDLKVAEFYLTHPDYAKANPYHPTPEDMAFYEHKFIEKLRPDIKKMAEKKGFMKSRSFFMNVHPDTESELSNEARDTVRKILEKNDAIEKEFNTAIELYNRGLIDNAIEQLKKALELQPDSPTMLYNLGVMYMRKEKYREAINAFNNSLKYLSSTGYTNINIIINPEVFMGVSVNLGMIYIYLEMYDSAIEVLKNALKFYPDDFDANWNLAVAYYTKGDITNAIPQLNRCLKLNPKSPEIHNAIGLLYYGSGLYYAALDEFQKAEEMNPDEKQYSYNKAVVLAKLGRDKEATEAFGNASGFRDADDMFNIYSQQIQMNKARELYNEGYSAMESNNISKAIELFEKAISIKPDMVEAYINLAVCYRAKNDIQKQIFFLEEAAKLKPNMPDIYFNLGLAYSDAKMYLNARYALESVIELRPSFKEAHFNLGTVHYKTGWYNEAIAEFTKCIELSPEWSEAYLNLGSSYLKVGKVEEAKSQFEKALQIKPNSAEANYSLGIVHTKLGNYDKAEELFKKALSIEPWHRMSSIMLKEIENYKKK